MANYLIVETGNEYNALACHYSLRNSDQRVVLFAHELSLEKSLQYVARRIRACRPQGALPDEYIPFLREAIHALFEDDDVNRRPVATRAIGWLASTLDHAVQRFAEWLQRQPQAPVSPAVITRDFILEVRRELNARSGGDEISYGKANPFPAEAVMDISAAERSELRHVQVHGRRENAHCGLSDLL